MSVYTKLTFEEIVRWLEHYSVGNLEAFEPISSGTVNSNYYVTCSGSQYILTVFETLPPETIKGIFRLNEFLQQNQVQCPQPIINAQNQWLQDLREKPAALIEFIPGQHCELPSIKQCQQIGTWLAKMHLATQAYPHPLSDTMGATWRQEVTKMIIPKLSTEDKNLLSITSEKTNEIPRENLPSGIIHADLFRDNVLFVDNNLTGVIDFYFACRGLLAYDLAITLNDWCTDEQGQFNFETWHALLNSYQALRPLTPLEQTHWLSIQKLAALRFWLSRLHSKLFPVLGDTVLIKDPLLFKSILQQLNDYPQHFTCQQPT